MNLYSTADRMDVDLSGIALPEHQALVKGDCYRDWAGIALERNVGKILEMGVYRGYAACAMLMGASEGTAMYDARLLYVGIDNESESGSSNAAAKAAIDSTGIDVFQRIISVNLAAPILPSALSEVLSLGPFDLVNCDAVHTRLGTLRQLLIAWPVTRPGGVIIIDDVDDDTVCRGIWDFLLAIGREGEAVRLQHVPNEHGWILLEKPPLG